MVRGNSLLLLVGGRRERKCPRQPPHCDSGGLLTVRSKCSFVRRVTPNHTSEYKYKTIQLKTCPFSAFLKIL